MARKFSKISSLLYEEFVVNMWEAVVLSDYISPYNRFMSALFYDIASPYIDVASSHSIVY